MGSTPTICTADSKPLLLKVALEGHLQEEVEAWRFGAVVSCCSRQLSRHKLDFA